MDNPMTSDFLNLGATLHGETSIAEYLFKYSKQHNILNAPKFLLQ